MFVRFERLGRLVRMIQFSSENVSGNTKEALLLVLFLLIFAVTARYDWMAVQHISTDYVKTFLI